MALIAEEAGRHRAQAAHVLLAETRRTFVANPSVITGGTASVTATVVNHSDAPAYGAEVRWQLGCEPHGDANPEPVG